MRKGLAILLVLGVLAKEGWAISAAPAIGGAIGGAVAEIEKKKRRKKQMECNNSEGKSVNREACQGQKGERTKGFKEEKKKGENTKENL